MGSYLKILMNVKLVGEKTVIFEMIHVNESVHKFISPILFISDDNFVIEKSQEFKYSPNRLVIPYKIQSDKTYITQYEFSSEQDRYNRLKKLYKNLLKFSKSTVFMKDVKASFLSHTLNMSEHRWFLY